jgi:hypothetical protein
MKLKKRLSLSAFFVSDHPTKLSRMKAPASFSFSGWLLIISGLLTGTCFELLRQQFSYPDILRMQTGYILQTYQASGPLLPLLWYGMTLGSVLLMVASLVLNPVLSAFHPAHQRLVTGLGILAGLFNTLGFIRWVFLVPSLAATYTNPKTSVETKEMVIVVFNAFHQYLGFSVGEHLGFMFLAFWGISLSGALYKTVLFPKWLSWLGILSSTGTFLGILEGIGLAWAAEVVAISSSHLIVWIILLGGYLIRFRLPEVSMTRHSNIAENSFETVS